MNCEFFTFAPLCDIPNWFTMIIELLIGGTVAIYFFIRQQKQGKKIQLIIDEQQEFRTKKYSHLIDKIQGLLNSIPQPLLQFYNRTQENNWEAEWNTNWEINKTIEDMDSAEKRRPILNNLKKRKQDVLQGKLYQHEHMLKPQYDKFLSILSLIELSEDVLDVTLILNTKKVAEKGKKYCKEWELHINNDTEDRKEPVNPTLLIKDIQDLLNQLTTLNNHF